MGFPYHTVVLMNGSAVNNNDRIVFGNFPNVATVAGASAGAAVVTAVTFQEAIKGPYSVEATANQDAVCFVTNKTPNGFTLTINPRLAANQLAAGTVDLTVVG